MVILASMAFKLNFCNPCSSFPSVARDGRNNFVKTFLNFKQVTNSVTGPFKVLCDNCDNPLALSLWLFVNVRMISSLEYLKDMGIKILRVYGNVIEEEKFPIPNKLKRIRQTAIHQVPKSLKRISLHHVIRNRRRSPYARKLKKYDKLFARMKKKNKEVPDEKIKKYLKVVLILLRKITHIAFCVV